jgi:hypothetical protein
MEGYLNKAYFCSKLQWSRRTVSLAIGEVMDVYHFYGVFKPLLIVYAVLTPVMGITQFLLNWKKEIVYRMTDRRGYKMVVTLDFKMTQDERHAALRELGLRPLEYKTKHLPPGVFKVEVLNAHEYDNA